jgi:PAS domain S-box-containing protein
MPKKTSIQQFPSNYSLDVPIEHHAGMSDKEQIVELRRRLSDITRLVSDWVWETNADGKLIFLTQRVMDHLGYQPFELYGTRLQELGQFTSPSGVVIEPNWRTPFRDFAFQAKDKEGNTKHFLISSLPIFDDNTGDFEGVRGTARDITESKKTAEAIRKSDQKFSNLIDASTQGILIHRHHKPLYANQTFVDMYGYESIEEVLSLETTKNLLHQESHSTSRHEAILNGTDSFTDREVRAVRADGSLFWVSNRGFGIDWEGGRAVCSCRVDITERKKVEEALREKEELFQGAVKTLREGFALYDSEDRFVLYNDEFLRLHSFARDEIKPGFKFEDFVKLSIEKGAIADARGREEEFLRERLELHRNPQGPIIRELSDGHWYIINESRTPDGGYVSAESDITELKKAENALRESEERHRLFAADVAHELRTPLAIMRSQLDSMEDSSAVQTLRQDVDSMSRLISQMLAAARLEFLSVSPTDKVDIHAVCSDVATYLAPFAVQQNRSIELLGVNGPVWANGDRDSLEQAVRNLVENAIKHTAENTTVSINVCQRPAIAVTDRGKGVDLEMRDKIFERFWSSDRRVGGAGLGLSIVQRTVDAHGGSLELHDNPEGGSVFTIKLNPIQP